MDRDYLEELDNIGSLPAGDPIPDAPISQSQIDFIEQLLRKSTYGEEKKTELFDRANSGITIEQGSELIDDLLQRQCSPLESHRNGELLTQKDTVKAIKQAVNMPNT